MRGKPSAYGLRRSPTTESISHSTRGQGFTFSGRARAQLGDAAGALLDTNLYVKSLEDEGKARSADQVAMLKVVFDTELKDEEIARIHAEAHAARIVVDR